MSNIIAVAGGSRGLGLAIVHEILKFQDIYTVKILSRSSNADLAQTLGVQVLVVDYMDIPGMTQVLEAEQVHTLISNVFISDGITPSQHNLIYAAEASSVTKRFVPSTFDVPYDQQ